MEYIFLLVGLVTGAVIAWLAANIGKKKVEGLLAVSERMLADEQEEKNEALEAKNVLLQKVDEQRNQLTAMSGEISEARTQLAVAQTQLKAEQEKSANELEIRREQFQQQIHTLQEQFENLAQRILSKSSAELKASNAESMAGITQPLREHLEMLQQSIRQTNSDAAKSAATLSEQLRAMGEQTQRMEASANRLTNVMRGNVQTQGSWGERLLTEILDANGFRQGIDYDVQRTITDEKGANITNADSGQQMRPDVILHYPNNEDVVIDSKMSIDAFYRFVNTDDEELKRKYADTLVKNLRTQMVRLARKEYARYIQKPREAVDFVIMFVPNDGALQLAMSHDPKLWGEAFERQVFITGQQNLMAILKIIQVAWRQYLQTENQKRVYSMAEELLKRIGEFIKRFDKVGKDIDALRRDYDDAYNKAYNGRQSIVQKANELKQLGVKENTSLPIPETGLERFDDNAAASQSDQSPAL